MSYYSDDDTIWHQEAKSIKKLDSTLKVKPEVKPLPQVKFKPYPTTSHPSYNSKKYKDINIEDRADVDSSTMRKITRGEYNIDASIDLHGMTQDEAFSRLEHFILKSYDERKRLLLVIVGKGKQSENNIALLKDQLPRWINSPNIRPLIINFKFANRIHGGEGAFYIFLKRVREG